MLVSMKTLNVTGAFHYVFVTVETVVYYKSNCRRQCCLGPSDSISIMLVVGKIQRHLFQVSEPAFVR